MSPFYRIANIKDFSRSRPYIVTRYIDNEGFAPKYNGTATQFQVVHGNKNEILDLANWLLTRKADEAPGLGVRYEGDKILLYCPDMPDDVEILNFFQATALSYAITDFIKEEEDEWARQQDAKKRPAETGADGLP